MKLAILGSDRAALDAYQYFTELGVQVRLFGEFSSGNELADISHKNVKIARVHKRFIPPSHKIENRSRMADTFRVVFNVNATTEIERQKLENPEIFEKLGKDVLESLKNSIESFEDFDFVCYSNELSLPNPMGAAFVWALNEKTLNNDERITYHCEHQSSLNAIREARNLCLVGSGVENLRLLNELSEVYLDDLTKTIQLVTSEAVPFGDIDLKHKELLDGFRSLLAKDREQFNTEVADFEKKIMEWRSLEPHIKAKTPSPAEPKPRLMIYNSAVVSSVDKLLDREGLFVTIEGSELLGGADQLKTLSCDRICVDQGVHLDVEKTKGLDQNEEGFYSLMDMSLDEIKEDMLKYFSKQD